MAVDAAGEPFNWSKGESFGCPSPSHWRPLRAAAAPVEPQLIETSPVNGVGLVLLPVALIMKQRNKKAIEIGNGFMLRSGK